MTKELDPVIDKSLEVEQIPNMKWNFQHLDTHYFSADIMDLEDPHMALAYDCWQAIKKAFETIEESKSKAIADFMDNIRRASIIANYRSSQVYMNGNDYFLSTRDLNKADTRNLYLILKEGDLELIAEEIKLKIDKGE